MFSASGDYVDFGTSQAQTVDQLGTPQTIAIRDRYFRLEGGYTYRPLRFITEFSLRAGVVRGKSPVPTEDSTAEGRDPFAVGLNYGAPSVRLRLADVCHVEGELLTSVTENSVARSVTYDAAGNEITVGTEAFTHSPRNRPYTRLNVATRPQSFHSR